MFFIDKVKTGKNNLLFGIFGKEKVLNVSYSLVKHGIQKTAIMVTRKSGTRLTATVKNWDSIYKIGTTSNDTNNPIFNVFSNSSEGKPLVAESDPNKYLEMQVGQKTSPIVNQIVDTSKLIEYIRLLNPVNLLTNYEINGVNKSSAYSLIRYPNMEFQQTDTREVTFRNQDDEGSRVFYPRNLSPDKGTDFFRKIGEPRVTSTITQAVTPASWAQYYKSDFPGGEMAVYQPLAKKISTETFSVICPITLVKTMEMLDGIRHTIDNSRWIRRDLDEYSHLSSCTIVINDLSAVSMLDLSELRRADGVTEVNITVAKGQDLKMASLCHLITMYKAPFFWTNASGERQFAQTFWDFSESVKIRRINVYTWEPDVFSQELKNINSLWWTDKDNLLVAKDALLTHVPARSSCALSDGLMWHGVLFERVSEIFDDQHQQELFMPITTLPSTIGLFKVVESTESGINYSDLHTATFLTGQILKSILLESIPTHVFQNLISEVCGSEELTQLDIRKQLIDYPAIVSKTFDGAHTSDNVYSAIYGTQKHFSFFVFSPGIVKKLYYQMYGNLSITDGFYRSTFVTSWLSYKVANSLENYPMAAFFQYGLTCTVKTSFSNMMNTTSYVVDLITNITHRAKTTAKLNLSNQPIVISPKSEIDQYTLPIDIRGSVLYGMDDVHISISGQSSINIRSSDSYMVNASPGTIASKVGVKDINILPNIEMKSTRKKNLLNNNFSNFFIALVGRTRGAASMEEVINRIQQAYNLISNYNFNLSVDYQNKMITILNHENNDGDYLRDLMNNLRLFGYNVSMVNTPNPYNKDSGGTGNYGPITNEDDDGPYSSQDDWNKRVVAILNSQGKEKYTDISKKDWGSVNINRRMGPFSDLILDIILRSAKRNENLLEITSGNTCLLETGITIINKSKLMLGGKYDYILNDFNVKVKSGEIKTSMSFIEYFKSINVGILPIMLDLSENTSFVPFYYHERSPRHIVVFETGIKHVSVFSDYGYKVLDSVLHERLLIPVRIENLWYKLVNISIRRNVSLLTASKYIREKIVYY